MKRTALVVGAAGGVGQEVVKQLLHSGYRVIGTVLNAAEFTALRGAAPEVDEVKVVDLGNAESVLRDLGQIDAALDAVVVCAAVAPYGPLETISLARLRATLEINAVSCVAIYQACMPRLRASRGRIVFISSFAGKVALPFLGAYSGSKFALEGLGDTMRREAAAWGVNVILVEPGGLRTPMVSAQMESVDRERAALSPGERELYGELYETYSKVFKQGWAGGLEPAAVAKVIVSALATERPEPRYVVGDDAQYMCGVVAAAPTREADAITAGFLANFAKS